MASNPKLPLTGSNAPIVIYVGGAPLPAMDLAKSWEITEQATKYSDKYLGRNRDRKDKKTTGFALTMELDYADSTLVKAIQDIESKREANQALPVLSVGIVLAERDGNFHGHLVQSCVGTYKISSRGKDERITQTIDIEGEDLVTTTL